LRRRKSFSLFPACGRLFSRSTCCTASSIRRSLAPE